MVLLTIPTFGELRSVYGSPRLVWFSTLVNVASPLTRTRSVMEKVLLTPAERLNSPGPSITPFGELPKRPIGNGCGPAPLPVRQGLPTVHVLSPGQVNPAPLIQFRRPCPRGVVLAPATRSAYWLR